MAIEKIATLQEVENHWSLDDLLEANAVLDISKEIEKVYSPKASKKGDKN